MAIPNLPQEIMLEIFLRLPAKSVGRFRCLSTTWNTHLSTKNFIDSYTKTHQNEGEEKLILINEKSLSIHVSTLDSKFNLGFSEEINLENHENKWPCLLASCDGMVLILLENKPVFMYVLNPITLQQVTLPYSSLSFNGFGYDSISDEYKVVCVGFDPSRIASSVDVYYLKTGVSKCIANPNGQFALPNVDDDNCVMPFVNGAVHWLGCYRNDKTYRVFAFDLEKETFSVVQHPNEVQIPNDIQRRTNDHWLMALKGCLSIVYRLDNYSCDVWMMKEYGDVDSWVSFRLDVSAFGRGVMPVCFVGDEKLLCFVESDFRSWYEDDGRCWVVRDLKDRTTQKIADSLIPFSISRRSKCCLFVESLVSPEPEPEPEPEV